jgi:alpha-mannosidase
MEQKWRFGRSVILQRIILKSGSRVLEFDTRVDWHEDKTMLRVRFPIAVSAAEARYEIPFGSIRRPTHEEDTWARAQWETAALQWVDLSQADRGVTLLNDCKHGYRIKGHTIDMHLIRSVPHPNVALIGKDDRSTAPAGHFTDQGSHQFRYGLIAHDGKWTEADSTAAARAFNIPLHIVPGDDGVRRSFLGINNEAIDIPTVKRAEDGRGWILRVCNTMDAAQEIRLESLFFSAGLVETNLQENDLSPANPDAPITLAPFEVKTFRVH